MADIKATWIGPGMRMLADIEGGPSIVLDSSHSDYGTHSGPTPMEVVLMGLAGCTAMDIVSVMGKKRQPMTSLQVKVSYEQSPTHPKIYTKIHLQYIAYGEGISEKALEHAIELSESTYCSVNAMLNKAAEITTSYTIVAAAAPYKPGKIEPPASEA